MEELAPEQVDAIRAIGDRVREESLHHDVCQIAERVRASQNAELYRRLRRSTVPTPDPDTGRYVYVEVDAATVAHEVRHAADLAVAFATFQLGLPSLPTVRWFTPETDADRAYVARYGRRDWSHITNAHKIAGCCLRDGAVWLSADLTARRVIRTAAHEVRHLAQDPDACPGANEIDALTYERQAQEAIRAHLSHRTTA